MRLVLLKQEGQINVDAIDKSIIWINGAACIAGLIATYFFA